MKSKRDSMMQGPLSRLGGCPPRRGFTFKHKHAHLNLIRSFDEFLVEGWLHDH